MGVINILTGAHNGYSYQGRVSVPVGYLGYKLLEILSICW